MPITLIKEGKQVINIMSLVINRRLTACLSTYDLTISPSLTPEFPLKTGDRIEFKLTREDENGNEGSSTIFLKAFVEKVSVTGTYSSHVVRISGRDYLADLVDSSIVKMAYKTPVSLTSLCTDVMNQNHMSFPVKDLSHGVNLSFTKDQKIVAQVGQKGFAFLQKYANQKNVYLLSDRDCNLTIQRAGNERLSEVLKNTFDGVASNNVQSMNCTISDTNIFHEIDVISQQNITAKGSLNKVKTQFHFVSENELDGSLDGGTVGKKKSTSTVIHRGGSIDPNVRNTRRLVMKSEESSTPKECEERAKWEQNARRYKGFSYQCEVDGYFNGDTLYDVNQLVRVKDDFADIDSVLMIKEVQFHYDLQNGESTTLSLTYQDALNPSPFLPQSKRRSTKHGAKVTKESGISDSQTDQNIQNLLTKNSVG